MQILKVWFSEVADPLGCEFTFECCITCTSAMAGDTTGPELFAKSGLNSRELR